MSYKVINIAHMIMENEDKPGWLLMYKGDKVYESPPYNCDWYYVCTQQEWIDGKYLRDQMHLFEGE